MSPPKASLIFLPGAWHGPECYSTIRDSLTTHGYKCILLPLQAVVQNPAVKDLEPDLAALRSCVLKELDEGHDVVVVGHSWSGIIVSGALSNLGEEKRLEQGVTSRVVKLAFLCAFIPPENTSLIQAFGGEEPEWYHIQGEWVTPSGGEHLFYNDLPAEEAAYWTSQLQPHSYATKFQGVSSVAWKTIPSSYLICEDDNAIPVLVQEAMVKACRDTGADMHVQRVKSGHSPFLSKPEEVVRFLRKAAGEDGI